MGSFLMTIQKMQDAENVTKLPARLDTNAAPELKALLLAAAGVVAGGHTKLDASEVDYVGGLCLQLLLSSPCEVTCCSAKAAEAFTLFGVYRQLVGQEGSGEA